ncbi:hypothetical protein Hanom_Chr07g00615281 [Helianthus anomalus]
MRPKIENHSYHVERKSSNLSSLLQYHRSTNRPTNASSVNKSTKIGTKSMKLIIIYEL